MGIPTRWISLLRRAPFVCEIADMWPEAATSTGMVQSGMVTRLLGQAARWMYRRAAAISVVSPGFKRNLIEKGVPDHKIHVIPNWADEALYRPVGRDPQLGAEFGLAGHRNIIYAGNMGPAQGLETLIQAANLLRDDLKTRFTLIGDGISLPELKAEAERLQLPNLRFIARQPASRMPDIYAWADGLLVQLRDDPLFRITLPSKCLAYLGCGRPIIAALAGDGADLIRKTQAGLVCAPGSATVLGNTIRGFFSLTEERRQAFGKHGRKAFLAQFTRKILADRYDDLFHQLADWRFTEPNAVRDKAAA
jgi:glycosyltransferase involved in cell wall biosynthesis